MIIMHRRTGRLFVVAPLGMTLCIAIVGAAGPEPRSAKTIAVQSGELDAEALATFLGVHHTVLKLEDNPVTAIRISCDAWRDGRFVKKLGYCILTGVSSPTSLKVLWRLEGTQLRSWVISDQSTEFKFPLDQLDGEFTPVGVCGPATLHTIEVGEETPIFKQYLDLKGRSHFGKEMRAGYDAETLARDSQEFDAVLVLKLTLLEQSTPGPADATRRSAPGA